MLNNNDVSEYLKISADGLEVRYLTLRQVFIDGTRYAMLRYVKC